MSNILKVCDCVTLYLKDAVKSGDRADKISLYRWEIPQGAYMSNERSQVCTVEVAVGALSTQGLDSILNPSPLSMTLQYINGGYNQHASSGRPVIAITTAGHFTTNSGGSHECHGTGQLLCQARPNYIEIRISNSQVDTAISGDSYELDEGLKLQGCITLKYSYYDAIGTGRNMQGEK
jgi:hypothetical protein